MGKGFPGDPTPQEDETMTKTETTRAVLDALVDSVEQFQYLMPGIAGDLNLATFQTAALPRVVDSVALATATDAERYPDFVAWCEGHGEDLKALPPERLKALLFARGMFAAATTMATALEGHGVQWAYLVLRERERQADMWDPAFDDKNTANDWAVYIYRYLGRASNDIESNLIKALALCVAALEQVGTKGVAPRHYEEEKIFFLSLPDVFLGALAPEKPSEA